jgi:hypothetical protein
MKTLRTFVVLTLLVGSLGFLAGCASRSSGGCSGGSCTCAPDRNCCDGCRQGSGCTCNR